MALDDRDLAALRAGAMREPDFTITPRPDASFGTAGDGARPAPKPTPERSPRPASAEKSVQRPSEPAQAPHAPAAGKQTKTPSKQSRKAPEVVEELDINRKGTYECKMCKISIPEMYRDAITARMLEIARDAGCTRRVPHGDALAAYLAVNLPGADVGDKRLPPNVRAMAKEYLKGVAGSPTVDAIKVKQDELIGRTGQLVKQIRVLELLVGTLLSAYFDVHDPETWNTQIAAPDDISFDDPSIVAIIEAARREYARADHANMRAGNAAMRRG